MKKRSIAFLLTIAMIVSLIPVSLAADAPAGVQLVLEDDGPLKQGESKRLLILGNDFPVDDIQYTVAEENRDKIEIDRDGNVRVKDDYAVQDGDTVEVTASIQYYDGDDVLFYENFEPKAPDVAGDLTEISEYGRFEHNDWGADGCDYTERAYTITDTNAAEGGQASRTGRYGVTQRDSKNSGLSAAYTELDAP
ncbi:MAG: hypothetical protein HFF17_04775 [Oscillospiraceae bacterium]|nr:hypothetical protein [Oscillospiraceae bacterium]